jgi:hypothetical protein
LALVFFGGEGPLVHRPCCSACVRRIPRSSSPLLILFRLRPGGAEEEKAEKPAVSGKALAAR